MILFIKNMVCHRCVMAVSQELEKLRLKTVRVKLGEVELATPPTKKQMSQFSERLILLGFEILDDQKQRQIEKIKNLLIKKIQTGDIEEHFTISDYLANALHKDYSYLSRLFSQVEGITIEQYFILQKIEKVKEWIVYGEMSLSEISYKLGYSSVAHLSSQFKKVTGLTPSNFKKNGGGRKYLDNV
ncbi:MAG: helix-turn-helix transcriptional regulator [Sediminibacterium magnilacihabitans]|jgi:AraC family transcriptional regulator|nr:helix-turn-helix transcriptional regulator [Sediminibacterium magnilacihabitans]PQV61814.1 AraC-like DNA-binding protein [Sediminibacterium magnilacihabitans]